MAENRLDVHVVTPEREVWTGEADLVCGQLVALVRRELA